MKLKMAIIHYRFLHSTDRKLVRFDGDGLSAAELRLAICKQEGIRRNVIVLADYQSYRVISSWVPKNSYVIVLRFPKFL